MENYKYEGPKFSEALITTGEALISFVRISLVLHAICPRSAQSQKVNILENFSDNSVIFTNEFETDISTQVLMNYGFGINPCRYITRSIF